MVTKFSQVFLLSPHAASSFSPSEGVEEYPSSDDFSIRQEHTTELVHRVCSGEATHIQIRILDLGRTGPSYRHL